MEYYRSASTTGDISSFVEIQSDYSLPSLPQAFWERARFGDSPEEVREAFDDIVFQARQDMHPDQQQEFDLVLPIIEWRMLGGAKTELPQGLVYERHDLTRNNWHVAHANDAVGWMLKASQRRLDEFGLSMLRTSLWHNVRQAEGLYAAVESLVVTSPLYRAFEACATDEVIGENQPLSGYWKTVRTAMLHDKIAQRWGIAEQEIGSSPNALKDLGRMVLNIDEERMPGRASQEDNSELAFTRALQMLLEAGRGLTYSGERPVRFEPKDDELYMTIHFEDGRTSDHGYSALVSQLERLSNTVTVGASARRVSEAAAKSMIRAIVGYANGGQVDHYAELLKEWRFEATEGLYHMFANEYNDMLIPAADGSLPNGALRTVSYDVARPGGVAGETPGYLANGESGDIHGAAVFNHLLPSRQPRMYVEGDPVTGKCTDRYDDDLRIRSQHKGVAVSGYGAVGIDNDGYTVLRPGGHDAYAEIPRDEGWFDTDELSRWYREHGLTEIANEVVERSSLHVTDLEAILYQRSRYIDAISPGNAKRATQLLSQNKFGSLTDHEGYFVTQCGGAAKLLKLSLDVVGIDAEIIHGHTITRGAIDTIGHAQVAVRLSGLPYMLDSTPRTQEDHETKERGLADSVKDSLARIAHREIEPLTPQEQVQKNITKLHQKLQAMYAVADKETLIEELARIPVHQRESDAIWRGLSLMAQIEREDTVDVPALRKELDYAMLVKGADAVSLQAAAIHEHDAIRLGAVVQTLETIAAIVDAAEHRYPEAGENQNAG